MLRFSATDVTNLSSLAHLIIIFVQAAAYSVCIFYTNSTEKTILNEI